MNVLFITLSSFYSINERGIYHDLMRRIIKEGHSVYIVTPIERRFKQSTKLYHEFDCQILRVRTLNIQKTNKFEKGIGTLLVEYQFKMAINKYLSGVKFDLIIYSTPPITFTNVVEFIKKRDQAQSYLLLKDIFPQNAVDLGMIRAGGFLHKYFRRKESALYSVSDRIGCMSPANVDYLCLHNPKVDHRKVHLNPNSIELFGQKELSKIDKLKIRAQYNIPENATIFIYGGNLGKPQGISFLIKVIGCYIGSHDHFFVIVGSGTEFNTISDWFSMNKPQNALLLPFLPKLQFDDLLAIADVGLIFLDIRFTIPNFPSRILSYMENKMPIIAATDVNTDIGKIIEINEFGFWCKSGDIKKMNEYIDDLSSDSSKRVRMGNNALKYLIENYTVDKTFSIIMK